MNTLGLKPGPKVGQILNQRVYRADSLLMLAAVIWGSAFVAQRVGMSYVGPLTFNGVRFALGALVLLPLTRRRDPQPKVEGGLLGSVMAWPVLWGGGLAGPGPVFSSDSSAGRSGLHNGREGRLYHGALCDHRSTYGTALGSPAELGRMVRGLSGNCWPISSERDRDLHFCSGGPVGAVRGLLLGRTRVDIE